MVQSPAHIERITEQVVADMASQGSATVDGAVLRVMSQLDRHTFSVKFGRQLLRQWVAIRVKQKFKKPLPENGVGHLLKNLPADVRTALGRVPAWICVDDTGGRLARHVPAIHASPADWEANARLKAKVAARTQTRSNESTDVANLLRSLGVESIAELIGAGMMDAAE